jgi:glycosyltransferase involved in cell wall biosynthesis
MIYIITSKADSHRDIVDYFETQGAQRLWTIPKEDSDSPPIAGKIDIVRSMLAARLLSLRRTIRSEDRLLVFGWHALPLLFWMKLGLIPRPRKLVVTGLYIQSDKTRRIVNRLIKHLRIPQLHSIAYTRREIDNLVAEAGLDRTHTHFQLWRLDLDGRVPASAIVDDGYLFSGGYSNRDYDTLLRALDAFPYRIVVAASRRNVLSVSPGKDVDIHRDIPEEDFELLLAKSRVVVLPLKDASDACGQSVLLRVLRNGKPLIATRHPSIELYFDSSYPGFVEVGDVESLAMVVSKAMNDAAFRRELADHVVQAQAKLKGIDPPGAEAFKIVATA